MNNFLRLSAVVMAAALLTGVGAFAQTSQNVTTTATVTTPITAAATAPLGFGTVTKGSTTTVLSSSANAGSLYFSGDESDNIIVTVPTTATISTTSGASADMTVTLDGATMIAGSSNVQGSATTADASSGTVTIALSPDADGDAVDGDGLGQAFIWIGGSVTPGATQQRGSYSGTFSISASYSN